MSHDTSQDTKTVTYQGKIVEEETILDFYNRLNHLRTVANVSLLTPPSLQNNVVTVKNGVEDVYSAITTTKNSISKLSESSITSPVIPTAGEDLLTAENTLTTIEKDIGTLENFCIAFTPACTTNNGTNRTTYTAANSSNKSGFNNGNRTGFNSSFFVVGNSSFRSSFFSSVFHFTHPHQWFPFHSSRCGSGRSAFHTTNKNSGKGTLYSSNFSGFFGSNFSGNGKAITHGDSSNWGTNTAVNAANFSGNDVGHFGSNFAANAGTCTVVHTTFSVRA